MAIQRRIPNSGPHWLALILVSALPLTLTALAQSETQAGPLWGVEETPLQFYGWRKTLARGKNGEIWLGASAETPESKTNLYRRLEGRWEEVVSNPFPFLRGYVMDTDPAGNLWICSYNPTKEETDKAVHLARFNGQQWQTFGSEPGIWPQTLTMVSEHEGWIGGNHGRLIHIQNGNLVHTALDLPEEQLWDLNILAIHMVNPLEGWLAGTCGLIAHYKEGRWRVIKPPPDMQKHHFFDLDVTGKAKPRVVGSNGTVAYLNEAGWQIEVVPTTVQLFGLDMVNENDGWIVGAKGTILRFDGQIWRQWESPTIDDLKDILMISPTEGFAVCSKPLRAGFDNKSLRMTSTLSGTRQGILLQPSGMPTAIDIDDDGDPDLISSYSDTISAVLNNGSAGFTANRKLATIHLDDENTQSAAYALGDVDNDGDLDLFVIGEELGQLLLNDGLGRYGKPDRDTGLIPTGGYGNRAYFIDFDLDGDLDLYIMRGINHSSNNLCDYLFFNDGTGRFHQKQIIMGDKAEEIAVLWGDLNGDMAPDAVLPTLIAELTSVYLNDGAGNFKDGTARAELKFPDGAVIRYAGLFDVEPDGDLDLLLGGSHTRLYLNDGTGRFTWRRSALENARTTARDRPQAHAVADLNNDGRMDVIAESLKDGRRYLQFYLGSGQADFKAIGTTAGIGYEVGSGIVTADWNGDGSLDLFISDITSPTMVMNRETGGAYLKVAVHGVLSNRSAIGAHVRVYPAGHVDDPAWLVGYQQVGMGMPDGAMSDTTTLHFGLPGQGSYDLRVTFPGGRDIIVPKVASDQKLSVYEYPGGLRELLAFQRNLRVALLHADPFHLLLWFLPPLLLTVLLVRLFEQPFRPYLLLTNAWVLTGVLAVYLLAIGIRPSYTLLGRLPLPVFILFLLALVDARRQFWWKANFVGHFRLESKLGEGAMGVVYRARDSIAKKTVALKVLHPELTQDARGRLRFLNEADLLRRMDHPNVIRIFDAGEISGRGFISMELLRGRTLSRLIQESGPLPPRALVPLIDAVCGALAHVHTAGVLHRDIKSDNIFILDETHGNQAVDWYARVKLMDFGLARELSVQSTAGLNPLNGTIAYMSPEQIAGKRLDLRSDIYALGVVMFEALTGVHPYVADTPVNLLHQISSGTCRTLNKVNPNVPAGLSYLVMKTLARDRQRRFANLNALRQALRALSIGTDTALGPISAPVEEAEPVALAVESESIWPVSDSARQEITRLHQRVGELSQLPGLMYHISTLDQKAAPRLVLLHMLEITGARRGALLQPDDKGNLVVSNALSLNGGEIKDQGFSISHSIAAYAFSSRQAIVVTEVGDSEVCAYRSIVELKLKALMAVPLITARDTIGVLYVDTDSEKHRLDRADVTLINAFTAQAALAMENARLNERLRQEFFRFEDNPTQTSCHGGLVGESPAILRVAHMIGQLADSDVTVLISGETGTGKEVVARRIHFQSKRSNQRFVAINAGALPDNLIESELFGHRRGAFSGAFEHKTGLFEAADGGTLFLDEIGEASPALQVRLLRLLETRSFLRVGETIERHTNTRFISATNRDLADEVKAGRFRGDLFYRLNVCPIHVPALRQRRADIPLLVRHFIEIYNPLLKRNVNTVPKWVMQELEKNEWPGNVRELANTVHRMLVFSHGEVLQGLNPEFEAQDEKRNPDTTTPLQFKTLAEVEKDYIAYVLKNVQGNQSKAADLLGLKRTTFRSRMKRLGLVQ